MAQAVLGLLAHASYPRTIVTLLGRMVGAFKPFQPDAVTARTDGYQGTWEVPEWQVELSLCGTVNPGQILSASQGAAALGFL